jgi:hypothetical protein
MAEKLNSSSPAAASLIDVGSVPYRQDFEGRFAVSEDDPVLASAQPIAALPFAMHRFNISRTRFAEMGNALENAQRHSPIDCAQLRLGFRCEGKTHGLLLTEELFDHVVVIPADNRLSSVRLRNPSAYGLAEHRANGFLREKFQETLGYRYLGIRKAVDQMMEGIAVYSHFRCPPVTSVASANANNNAYRPYRLPNRLPGGDGMNFSAQHGFL